MQVQGNSDLAYQMQIISAQLSKSQQEQQGQAALQLLEASAVSAPVGNSGTIINAYAWRVAGHDDVSRFFISSLVVAVIKGKACRGCFDIVNHALD